MSIALLPSPVSDSSVILLIESAPPGCLWTSPLFWSLRIRPVTMEQFYFMWPEQILFNYRLHLEHVVLSAVASEASYTMFPLWHMVSPGTLSSQLSEKSHWLKRLQHVSFQTANQRSCYTNIQRVHVHRDSGTSVWYSTTSTHTHTLRPAHIIHAFHDPNVTFATCSSSPGYHHPY